jgi:hypothetical protein
VYTELNKRSTILEYMSNNIGNWKIYYTLIKIDVKNITYNMCTIK